MALQPDGERQVVSGWEDDRPTAGGRGRFDRLVDGGRIDGLAVAGRAKRAHIELHRRQRRRGGLFARTHCWNSGNDGGGKTHAAESQKVAGVNGFHIAAMLAEPVHAMEIISPAESILKVGHRVATGLRLYWVQIVEADGSPFERLDFALTSEPKGRKGRSDDLYPRGIAPRTGGVVWAARDCGRSRTVPGKRAEQQVFGRHAGHRLRAGMDRSGACPDEPNCG